MNLWATGPPDIHAFAQNVTVKLTLTKSEQVQQDLRCHRHHPAHCCLLKFKMLSLHEIQRYKLKIMNWCIKFSCQLYCVDILQCEHVHCNWEWLSVPAEACAIEEDIGQWGKWVSEEHLCITVNPFNLADVLFEKF